MKKYIEKQFESGEKYIESTSQGYPIWWREFEGIINEANTLSDLNSRLMNSKTTFKPLPMLVKNITIFNPFIFNFLTENPSYLQCFYEGHIKGKKEFKKTYFIKYPNEQQIKVITRKFNDDFKKTILFGQGFFNESNVTMAGFQNGILTAYWLFENSFLENKNQQTEVAPPQPIDKEQNRTKKVIAETFENMDKKGWQYAFATEQDYNLFTDLLTNFFEYKPYTLPETIIQLKRTCKTKVAKALGEIHKELSNENKLTTDTEYFQLIRVLSHFEKVPEGDLYKALTR